MAENKKALGAAGEQVAAQYLQTHGYRIRARNYRVPIGEIDIVAEQQGILVFAEVKTRRSTSCGTPAQSVGYRKQQKIIQTASWYLRQEQLEGCPCRFDIIEVYVHQEKTYEIRHLRGAFET